MSQNEGFSLKNYRFLAKLGPESGVFDVNVAKKSLNNGIYKVSDDDN